MTTCLVWVVTEDNEVNTIELQSYFAPCSLGYTEQQHKEVIKQCYEHDFGLIHKVLDCGNGYPPAEVKQKLKSNWYVRQRYGL